MKKMYLSLILCLLLLGQPSQGYSDSKALKTTASCLLTLGFHCIAEYYFIAQNTRNCELYSGLVPHNLMLGGAKTHFYSPNGSECKGKALPPHYRPNPRTHVGSEGKIHAMCTDTRSMEGLWVSDSLTTGHGIVTDNVGDSYNLTFGWSAQQAADGVNRLRNQLGCSPVQADGPVLSVEGKILRTK